MDDPEACDLDDAVHVSRLPEGWLLRVAVADVASCVTPGSALDMEARLRGNSVYFPGLTLPMLPERLSGNLCSLLPGEDRSCLVFSLSYAADGLCTGFAVRRAVIRSVARVTYEEADSGCVPEEMTELAALLERQAERRVIMDLALPEPGLRLNAAGDVAEIVARPRTSARRMIELFMVEAGRMAGASLADRCADDVMFRCHAPPPLAQLRRLFRAVCPDAPRALSHRLDRRELLREVRRMAQSSPVAGHALWKILRPAEYSMTSGSHAGLALPVYTQVTSPIRRYADLLAHRSLTGQKAGKPDAALAQRLIRAERHAATAVREVISRAAGAFLLRENIQHEAIILESGRNQAEVMLLSCGLTGYCTVPPIVTGAKMSERETFRPPDQGAALYSLTDDHPQPRPPVSDQVLPAAEISHEQNRRKNGFPRAGTSVRVRPTETCGQVFPPEFHLIPE
ncbi:ribonuclease catalytic domain-containing protein [Acetobacter sp. AN02]|uniref:ribonuclease catalytic domain-containing protein n=1 Tax=Acetobacter sp. AN02 TaxID=2894186 RepID=UPI0024345919|nr:ribonuclease catalytic domain-containing protein [Acetobacter sp. AN02]MDG6095077.1 ribonuclease catalytic domain-containing protein [Acetobacter sp. AN02]